MTTTTADNAAVNLTPLRFKKTMVKAITILLELLGFC